MPTGLKDHPSLLVQANDTGTMESSFTVSINNGVNFQLEAFEGFFVFGVFEFRAVPASKYSPDLVSVPVAFDQPQVTTGTAMASVFKAGFFLLFPVVKLQATSKTPHLITRTQIVESRGSQLEDGRPFVVFWPSPVAIYSALQSFVGKGGKVPVEGA